MTWHGALHCWCLFLVRALGWLRAKIFVPRSRKQSESISTFFVTWCCCFWLRVQNSVVKLPVLFRYCSSDYTWTSKYFSAALLAPDECHTDEMNSSPTVQNGCYGSGPLLASDSDPNSPVCCKSDGHTRIPSATFMGSRPFASLLCC